MRSDFDRRIPVIDLFAGPGGLAEGFSAFDDELGWLGLLAWGRAMITIRTY